MPANPVHVRPAELGYRMPAEWAPHQATWLSWPHREATWPGKFEPIPSVMAELVAALVPSEHVHINVNDDQMATEVRALLAAAGVTSGYTLHPFPTNDAWCRDHGSLFVTREVTGHNELAAVHFGYNAWGQKWSPWTSDEQIPRLMARELSVPSFDGGMILEGGSGDVDGAGLLLTTEACLLNPNRNPELTREQIEGRLRDALGIEKILWLAGGIEGDDTDGHVDDVTRFVDHHTVVTALEDDPTDVNYAVLQENLRRLTNMTGLHGHPLEVIALPMPGKVAYQGQRLPASYANFYVANRVVIVPTYRHPHDARAQAILQELFPGRDVIGIDAWDLIWGRGAFHCLTQQVPAL